MKNHVISLLIIVAVLLSVNANAQTNRRNTKKSVAYRANYQRMATGRYHTLEIREGTLWAWGLNDFGQLGDGTNTDKSSPVQIGTDNNWISISGGDHHSFGLKSDGTLWSWGYNGDGELGDGTTNNHNSPEQVGTDNKWIEAAGAYYHSLGLKSDGTIWAWGQNNAGQLGDGTTTGQTSPMQIGTENNWVSVSVGGIQSFGLKSDGTLWAWGYNDVGELGDGTNTDRHAPTQIGTDTKWVSITSGQDHNFGLKSDGTLWGWGLNNQGQLGDGSGTNKNSPEQIGTDNKWVNCVAGYNHSLGLKVDGTLWSWGQNYYGSLGDGGSSNQNSPIQVGTDNKWVNVSAGNGHSFGLKADGTLWSWGYNDYGQLGDGTTTVQRSPVQTSITLSIWLSIDAGYNHTLGLKSDGTLWSWGLNDYGQLGYSTITQTSSPIQIGTDNKWISIAAGYIHSLGLKSDGTLWAWGYNDDGELGDGTIINRNIPTQIGTDNKWVSIAGASTHSVGLKSDGTLWVWGKNNFNQLGDGTTTKKTSPEQIGSDTKWISIAAFGAHTIGLKSDGSLWTWGYNAFGQIGDGSTTNRSSPVQIGADNKWVTIGSGFGHSLGLKSDGTFWAWGYNNYGDLGDGTIIQRNSPIQVGSDNKWVIIGAGIQHTLGIKSDGFLWACGYNASGALGDGTFIQTRTSLIQIGTDNRWVKLTARYFCSLGLKSDRTMYCGTGNNLYGTLGDGTTLNKNTFGCNTNCSLSSTSSQLNVLCFGSSTGSIDLSVTSGTTGYAYLWTASGGGVIPSGQSANQDLTGLKAGIYKVIVTNSNGCSATTNSVTITQPSSALSTTKTQVNVLCFGNSTGSIDLSVSGGTPGYTYLWTASGGGVIPSSQSTNQDITDLKAGVYTVTVTDAHSCTTTASCTITQPDLLVASASGTNIECGGNNDGTVSASVTGGTPPYSYQWTRMYSTGVAESWTLHFDPAGNTSSLSGIPGGGYLVVVTDANGCTAYSTYDVTEPFPLEVTVSGTNVTCNGYSNGSVSAVASFGTPGYSYLWSNDATTTSLSDLSAGTYTVTVTDANGCIRTKSYTVTQPPELTVAVTGTNVACAGATTGSATAVVSGGTVISTASTFENGTFAPEWTTTGPSSIVTNLSVGFTYPTEGSSQGCVYTSGSSVGASALESFCGIASGSISSVISGTLYGGSAMKRTVTVYAGDVLNVDWDFFTDGHAPFNDGSFLTISGIGINFLASVTTTPTTPLTGFAYLHETGYRTFTYTFLTSGTYTISLGVINVGDNTVRSGLLVDNFRIGFYSYSWNTNPVQTGSTATGLGPGTYTVTVTDALGCTATSSQTISVNDVTPPVALCKVVTVTLVNGTASVTPAQVDNGSHDDCGIQSLALSKQTFNCTNLGPNNVVLTVTDNNNNVSTCLSAVIVTGAIPSCNINVTPSNATFTGGDPKTIYLGYGPQFVILTAASYGGSSFSYSWTGSYLSGTGNVRVFAPTNYGIYNIVCSITNNFGCQSTCTVSICVRDISSTGSGNTQKVYICHAGSTLDLNVNAVPAHLAHGDYLGHCNYVCGMLGKTGNVTSQIRTDENDKKETELIVFPNPTNTIFNFKLESTGNELFSINVYDISGRLVMNKENLKPNETIAITDEFANGMYVAVVVQGDWRKTVKLSKIE